MPLSKLSLNSTPAPLLTDDDDSELLMTATLEDDGTIEERLEDDSATDDGLEDDGVTVPPFWLIMLLRTKVPDAVNCAAVQPPLALALP